MRAWRWLNNLRWYARCPLKLVLLTLGVGLVLYPKPWLIPTLIQRSGDINSVLDPEHPGLAPFEADVRARLPENADARAALPLVEQVVCTRVPYAFDWETWGVVAYLPTVDEVLKAGREDCDGRGVVAASLLRRMGYEAWLVSDMLHLWVRTPLGDTMSPSSSEATVVMREGGSEVNYSLNTLRNASRGLAFGVAVFPLVRELIIVAMICALAIHPRSSIKRRLAGCGILVVSLFVIRHSGESAAISGGVRDVVVTIAGAALVLVGWLTLLIRGAASPGRFDSGPAESPAENGASPG